MVIINHSELLSLSMQYPSTATQPGSGQMLVAACRDIIANDQVPTFKIKFFIE